MTPLKLALDWTPNINHIGFFIALENGFYRDLGLKVDLIDPSSDNYELTPAKKVELGQADLALCPTESVISYRTKTRPFDLIGIATVFQKDLSAIVVREGEGINSPKDLDGKSYSSYEARYEDRIVKQMIRNDGGVGDLSISHPNKLGIWDTVITKKYDSTWVFLNWEGVEAENFETKLRYFKMEEYEIPYSYSPLLVTSESAAKDHSESFRSFLKASKKGFEFCQEYPKEAVKSFRKFVPGKDAKIDLHRALEISSDAFGQDWGKMETSVVGKFLDWIYNHDLEKKRLEVNELITNDFLI